MKLPKYYTKLTFTVGTLVAEVGSAVVFMGSAADEVGGVSPAMEVGGVGAASEALSCAIAWSKRQDTLLIRYKLHPQETETPPPTVGA